jgi:hypothetical protein|tara:strand:+ start:603 stop:1298 length:696 start_codon:yes stop_codon:yes gene_type:complete
VGYEKKIICLANSRKKSGRCIAGREVLENDFGPWIRPVSIRPTKEISEKERRYENGRRAVVFDIIKIPLLDPVPVHHHVEDHLIDADLYWSKKGMANWGTIEGLLDPLNSPLWINGDSTYHGMNDKISETLASGLQSSLMLIRPSDLKILVRKESGFAGSPERRCVRAEFNAAEAHYRLKVTDPIAEEKYLSCNDGTYPLDGAILCVSLGEAWKQYVFKLVAAILTPDMIT